MAGSFLGRAGVTEFGGRAGGKVEVGPERQGLSGPLPGG
jgi:hypothetical protein